MYTKHVWNSDKHFNFNYVQYLPKDFNPEEKYPLVFFLHGAGERGGLYAERRGDRHGGRQPAAEAPGIPGR